MKRMALVLPSIFRIFFLYPAFKSPLSPAPQRLEVVWDSDSLDWKDLPASEITQRVTSKVQPGSIVLFHNAALHTPEALPAILETLLQEGYTFPLCPSPSSSSPAPAAPITPLTTPADSVPPARNGSISKQKPLQDDKKWPVTLSPAIGVLLCFLSGDAPPY